MLQKKGCRNNCFLYFNAIKFALCRPTTDFWKKLENVPSSIFICTVNNNFNFNCGFINHSKSNRILYYWFKYERLHPELLPMFYSFNMFKAPNSSHQIDVTNFILWPMCFYYCVTSITISKNDWVALILQRILLIQMRYRANIHTFYIIRILEKYSNRTWDDTLLMYPVK